LGFYFLALLFFIFLFFLIFLILIFPVAFTFFSLLTFFTFPLQIFLLVKEKRVRENHTLEHATINILEKKYGYRRISGISLKNGFFLFAPLHPNVVFEAAHEALYRLKEGEVRLAIHRECGTTAGTAAFILSFLFLVLLYFLGFYAFFFLPFLILAASFLGKHLGILVQRFLTTTSRLEDLEISGVEFAYPFKSFLFLFLGPQIFVRTQQRLKLDQVLEGELT
jgi:hypothetical protein